MLVQLGEAGNPEKLAGEEYYNNKNKKKKREDEQKTAGVEKSSRLVVFVSDSWQMY